MEWRAASLELGVRNLHIIKGFGEKDVESAATID